MTMSHYKKITISKITKLPAGNQTNIFHETLSLEKLFLLIPNIFDLLIYHYIHKVFGTKIRLIHRESPQRTTILIN